MQLGRYEILQQLSTGPVADVLLARATGPVGFTRHVVLKRIRPELAADARFVKAFLAEARIAASLHHQNIVQVHDVGEDAGAFFAMEYVHGEDIRKILLRVRELDAQVPVEVIIAIGAAAAAGLHHAHEQLGPDRAPLGLVHRDVSPGNILVGFDGSVKLTDFGLAKPALSAIKTRSGVLTGKAPYMSPELCTGEPVERRSDVFALGIVLYELATARRLFKGDNEHQTMAAIAFGEVAPPSALRPNLPRALDAIILRALAKAPADRYATAQDLRAALEGLAVELELRATGKALADYMTQLFGARAEPWDVDAPTAARDVIDSESDFDHAGAGLVAAPPGTVERIAKVRAGSEGDEPTRELGARPDEPTLTPDAVPTRVVPAAPPEPPEPPPLPEPMSGASAALPALPVVPVVPVLPVVPTAPQIPRRHATGPVRRPAPPEDEATLLSGTEVTGTVTDVDMDDEPEEQTRDLRRAKLGRRTRADSADTTTNVLGDDDDDEPGSETTVTPPLFEPTDPVPLPRATALGHGPPATPLPPPPHTTARRASQPQAALPVPAAASGSQSQPMQPMPLPLPPSAPYFAQKPPWVRYVTVALIFAIPLAVGVGARSCSRGHYKSEVGAP